MKKRLTKIMLSMMATAMLVNSSMTVFACDQCDTQLVRSVDHSRARNHSRVTTIKTNHAILAGTWNNVSGHFLDDVNTCNSSGASLSANQNYLTYNYDNGASVDFEHGTYRKPDGTILHFDPKIFGKQYYVSMDNIFCGINRDLEEITTCTAESFAHYENMTIEKVIQLGVLPANVLAAWELAAYYDREFARTMKEQTEMLEGSSDEEYRKKMDEGWEYNNKEHEYYELGLERLYGLQ